METARRQQVIDPEQLAELTQHTNSHGLWRLGQQFLALALLGTLAFAFTGPIAWVAYLGYGVLLIFCFCPLHESVHGSLFRSPSLNRITGVLLGLILMLPPRSFEAFHMAHHRHTQIPERDPELLSPKPATRGDWLIYVSGFRYWKAQLQALFSNSLGRTDDFVPTRRRIGIVREARIFLGIYVLGLIVSLATSSLVLWWGWLLAVLIGQPFLRLYLLAEHTGCPEVRNMFENTRTTLTNRLMGWLCWNMNYHTAHHAYAGIPFWRLADANELIAKETRVISPGYIAANREIFSRLGDRSAGQVHDRI